jgi:hypothetical protein
MAAAEHIGLAESRGASFGVLLTGALNPLDESLLEAILHDHDANDASVLMDEPLGAVARIIDGRVRRRHQG